MERPLAFVLLLLGAATAGSARSLDAIQPARPPNLSSSTAHERAPPIDPVISLPIGEYATANGSKMRQRGIIIGKDIAPNMTLGFGFGDLKPRKSALSPDPQLDAGSRKSRKAAIRLNVRF